MAIRPMDMQVLLPKLHKNDLLKPHVVNKQENEQQLMHAAGKHDVKEKIQKVNDFEQKESPHVRDDGRRGAGGGHSGGNETHKHADSDHGEGVSEGSSLKYSHIDIKV